MINIITLIKIKNFQHKITAQSIVIMFVIGMRKYIALKVTQVMLIRLCTVTLMPL